MSIFSIKMPPRTFRLPGRNRGESNNTSAELTPRSADDDYDSLSNEGKTIYRLLAVKLDSIVEEVMNRDDLIEHLKKEKVDLKTRILKIEQQLDSQETVNRCNNLILSGNSLTTIN